MRGFEKNVFKSFRMTNEFVKSWKKLKAHTIW